MATSTRLQEERDIKRKEVNGDVPFMEYKKS